MVGAVPDPRYSEAEADVPAGSRLYLFSDGIFELATQSGPWGLRDFVRLLSPPVKTGVTECQRIYSAVKAACRPGQFEDDVSLMVVTFP